MAPLITSRPTLSTFLLCFLLSTPYFAESQIYIDGAPNLSCVNNCFIEEVAGSCPEQGPGLVTCQCEDPPKGVFLDYHACIRSGCTTDERQEFMDWFDGYCKGKPSGSKTDTKPTPTSASPAQSSGLGSDLLVLFDDCTKGCIRSDWNTNICTLYDWTCFCANNELYTTFRDSVCRAGCSDTIDPTSVIDNVCRIVNNDSGSFITSMAPSTSTPAPGTNDPPETSNSNENNNNKGSSTPVGAIVGGVVGGVAALAIIGICAWLFIRRRNQVGGGHAKAPPMDVGTGVEDMPTQGVWDGKQETYAPPQWQPPPPRAGS